MDDIEQRAKELFWRQSEALTGNRWDWDKAGEEVQDRFRTHARNGTAPPTRQDIYGEAPFPPPRVTKAD